MIVHNMADPLLRADIVAKGILGWITLISIFLGGLALTGDGTGEDNGFFKIGPNERLRLFGRPINTLGRYFLVVFYTMVSTVVRTLQQEVVSPWIIQSVQNNEIKSEYVLRYGMLVVIVNVTYIWVDWFMYINILLAQVDLLVIEMAGNVAMSMYTTGLYLGHQRLLT